MRHGSFMLVAALLVALIGGAVALFAYDSSRDDRIAEGVTVAGVDVGELSAGQARAELRRTVAAPLERPIAVVAAGRRFRLSAREARVRTDVGGMVDEALRESRDGTILSRTWRDLVGGQEDVEVPARVSYSRAAVDRLVARVERTVNRSPRDARVAFPSLARVKERNGVEVKADLLRGRIQQALTVQGVDRTVEAPTRVTRPRVTSAELADRYPVVLVADRAGFQLRLYTRLRLARSYTIAVGQLGFDTPAGLYHVQNKAVNPAWHVPNKAWAGELAGQVIPPGSAQNPLKARWLGIYDGAGIHGTSETWSLGSAASHGCIRMAIPDVIELYDKVPVGAPIYIA